MNDKAQTFEQLAAAMRRRLHRYCARMTGSVLDGEDVVQDALLKAFEAHARAGVIDNPQGWLLRIAHNTALDFLRRRARGPLMEGDAALETMAAPLPPDPEIAATSLRSFMHLPALQRSAVILRDVLDHSLAEAAAIIGASEPAVKSALQRGRATLRAVASAPPPAPLTMDSATRARLIAYVDGFKLGDFDAVRAMLAEDVRLDLVAKLQRRGNKEVGQYFGAYAAATQWMFSSCCVEGRPAMQVFDRNASLSVPAYFVALEFDGAQVTQIRDFLFARYAMEHAEIAPLA